MFKVQITKSEMNETRMSNSFKSYVGFEDNEPLSLSTSVDESCTDIGLQKLHLLPGEMVIAEAKKVLMFAPVSEQRQGKSGILSVTNFKLSFITSEEKPKEELGYQQNLLLGDHEICLSNVDIVYQIMNDNKKRRLLPGNNVSGKVKGLHILCKNMKVLSFSFKFSPLGHGKTLTNALLHHAYPRRHQLLFAYDYREPYYRCQRQVCLYRDPADWSRDLSRPGCVGWRLSAANQSYQLSTSLPQWLAVPAEVLDWQLGDAARHFRASRPPVWCWSSPGGAALVRMADVQPTITDRAQENAMLESVRKSHPQRRTLVLMDLGKELPSTREVQASYVKLRELCTPETIRQFWLQDGRFSSLLEASRWLHTVSLCLGKAAEAADAIERVFSVVLQEGEGRDMCCVVSSLTQLLLDDRWRTLAGFQSLVQKEWVVLGHPFCTRLAHVMTPPSASPASDNASEQSPVFLVFLDCVWQLLRQFPTAFQFTETYLTTLWDSAHVSVFETFLFDSERDRSFASTDPVNPLTMRSVWDWGEQFAEKDIALFTNPLYRPGVARLRVQPGVPMLDPWSQCYYRWLPPLEIRRGGAAAIDLQSRLLVAEVNCLRGDTPAVWRGDTPAMWRDDAAARQVSSFFPFSRDAGTLVAGTMALDNSYVSGDPVLDSQSLLNAPD